MSIAVKTDYWQKPIPDRRFDWIATLDSYDGPGSPIGNGRTEAEALEDLAMTILNKHPDIAEIFEVDCPRCKATGKIEVTHPRFAFEDVQCPDCHGNGHRHVDIDQLASISH